MEVTWLQDLKKMPWKNGGGITHEYQIAPKGSSIDSEDFQWRISVAEVQGEGEFSLFPERKRWLALWRGPLVEIFNHNQQSEHLLDAKPWHFSGQDKKHYRQQLTESHNPETSWDLGIIYNPLTVDCKMSHGLLAKQSSLRASFDREFYFILDQSPYLIELSKNENYELKNQTSLLFYQLCLTFK